MIFTVSKYYSYLQPYEILGVKRSSTSSEIKKAYKRMARELHPDKNTAPDANDRFAGVSIKILTRKI